MPVIRMPKIGTMFTGFVIILPKSFDANKPLRVILFAHGIGQRGDGSGVNTEGWMKTECPNLISLVENSNCILIAPELYFNEFWSTKYFDVAFEYLTKNYRIEPKVFLSGVSLGGQEILSWGAANPDKVEGIHGCCAVTTSIDFCKIKCPVLMYAAKDDGLYGESLTTVNKILACDPNAPVKLVTYPTGGHSIWNKVYAEPEVIAFLTGATTVTPVAPVTPVSTLKADTSATLTSVKGSTAVLDGSKSVGYKQIGTYKELSWVFISGPSWNVFPNYNKSGEKISLQNLVPGEYEFELIARDDKGNKSSERVKLTVMNGKEVFREVTIDGVKFSLYKDGTYEKT